MTIAPFGIEPAPAWTNSDDSRERLTAFVDDVFAVAGDLSNSILDETRPLPGQTVHIVSGETTVAYSFGTFTRYPGGRTGWELRRNGSVVNRPTANVERVVSAQPEMVSWLIDGPLRFIVEHRRVRRAFQDLAAKPRDEVYAAQRPGAGVGLVGV